MLFSRLLLSPEGSVSSSHYLSDRNRIQVEKWNSKPLDCVERTIHDVVIEIMQRSPSEEAVCAWDGSLTYLEFYQYASRLAGLLLDLKVGPEVVVPLCFDKSMWNVVAIFGVLMAGGACKFTQYSIHVPKYLVLASRKDCLSC